MALLVWVDSTLQYIPYIHQSFLTVLWIPEVNNDLVYCIFGLVVQWLCLCDWTLYHTYISPCTVLWIPEVNNDLVYCIFGLVVQWLCFCGWTLHYSLQSTVYRIYNIHQSLYCTVDTRSK